MTCKRSILASAIAITLVGCSWSAFDDLADEAWVNSTTAPGDLNADDYGVAVAYGAGAATAGVKFFVAGLRPDGIVQITYDAAGNASTSGELISANAASPNPLRARPPLVGDPTSTTGAVAIGLSEGEPPIGRVIVSDHGEVGPQISASIEIGAGDISTLAFGLTNNPDNPATTDLVATHGNVISIVSNYVAPAARTIDHCRIVRDDAYATVVGELDSGNTEQEIVVAMGNISQADAPSEVQILSGALIAAASDSSENLVQCLDDVAVPRRDPLFTIDPPASEPDFGARLLIADFDGNGASDLAVSAPKSNTKVYVFMNIDLNSAGPATPLEVAAPAGSAAFGDSLTAGDFDGDGKDELVVGDSMATVDGTTTAGRAYIFALAGSAFGAAMMLGDAQPEQNQRFGRSMTVARFAGSDDILIVAAEDEVFTFFRTPVANDSDVRE